MKVLWLSESGFKGKVPATHDNMRTEMAWINASDGLHCPFNQFDSLTEEFDIGIAILPKREELLNQLASVNITQEMRTKCHKIGVMQEGPHYYFQDYSVGLQVWFHATLNNMDFIMCHNEQDKKYYNGIFDVPVFVNRTLMIEDAIAKDNLYNTEDKVIIGGNLVRWYGGWDSYMVALTFDLPIYAPRMGRMKPEEASLDSITHIPYVNWQQWIRLLSQFKYAVHLMPTQAAGTFALNCAYHGIPCIGYQGLDTQQILYPLTSVGMGDIESAVEVTNKLQDKDFYQMVSDHAKANYECEYGQEIWKQTFFGNMETILNSSS